MALSGADMFATTVAGNLPKPLWLAEPEKLWPAWRLEGNALAAGKIDTTILAVKRQEDAGIDIVSDGEQARIHFVHGFLTNLDGVDFARLRAIAVGRGLPTPAPTGMIASLQLPGRSVPHEGCSILPAVRGRRFRPIVVRSPLGFGLSA